MSLLSWAWWGFSAQNYTWKVIPESHMNNSVSFAFLCISPSRLGKLRFGLFYLVNFILLQWASWVSPFFTPSLTFLHLMSWVYPSCTSLLLVLISPLLHLETSHFLLTFCTQEVMFYPFLFPSFPLCEFDISVSSEFHPLVLGEFCLLA